MEIVQEEVKAKNGPNGAKSGVVIDKDTNEPIATYKKNDYGKGYKVQWHPGFVENNPGVKTSYEGMNLQSIEPESLSAVEGHVYYHLNHMANHGFEDRHKIESLIPENVNPEHTKARDLKYYDKETGEHLATRHINPHFSSYNNADTQTNLSDEFIAKHNIAPDVVTAVNRKLTAARSHLTFANELNSSVAELRKKKMAQGTNSYGGASMKEYSTSDTPENVSAEHEKRFDAHVITRLSPTHFIAKNKDGRYVHHSIAYDGVLHHLSTPVHDAKVNSHSF